MSKIIEIPEAIIEAEVEPWGEIISHIVLEGSDVFITKREVEDLTEWEGEIVDRYSILRVFRLGVSWHTSHDISDASADNAFAMLSKLDLTRL